MANTVSIQNLSNKKEWKEFVKMAQGKGWQHAALFVEVFSDYKKREDKKDGK